DNGLDAVEPVVQRVFGAIAVEQYAAMGVTLSSEAEAVGVASASMNVHRSRCGRGHTHRATVGLCVAGQLAKVVVAQLHLVDDAAAGGGAVAGDFSNHAPYLIGAV